MKGKDANKSERQSRLASTAWQTLTPPLSNWIVEATQAMGFDRMTPVQASTIPLFTGNKDVVVEAVTGSGKTLAFLIPVIERLLRLQDPIKKHHVGAIIISPTRELATQIHSVLLSLLAFHPPSASLLHPDEDAESTSEELVQSKDTGRTSSVALKIIPQLLLGGTSTPKQDLSHFLTDSPNLLIATPGRLLELLSSPHVHCPQSSFEVLVLDEADRLLDLGFKDTLQKIITRLPKQRRTGLFSASVTDAVDQLVRVGLRNPVRVAVKVRSSNSNGPSDATSGHDDTTSLRTPASLQMTYLTVSADKRLPTLIKLLTTLDPPPQKAIVYLSTCAAVDYFQHILPHLLSSIASTTNSTSSNITIIPLHGKHNPTIRNKNFTRFLDPFPSTTTLSRPTTRPPLSLLLTTDLASRGLDIPTVDLSLQLDPPSNPSTFLHRAGRAGRAGRRGLSVVFLLPGRESNEYPPFLSVRRTPVSPLPSHLASTTVSHADTIAATTTMRNFVLTDRALHEKAQRAFVSWVRSYAAHAASSIFRVGELPWAELAEGWGLLRMPRMPELKKVEGWEGERERALGLEVDWREFGYRDQEREAKRRREMVEDDGQGEEDDGKGVRGGMVGKKRPGKRDGAWSTQQALQAEREQRREKRVKKRERTKEERMSESQKSEMQEVQRMIAEVRRRNLEGPGVAEGEWEGFD